MDMHFRALSYICLLLLAYINEPSALINDDSSEMLFEEYLKQILKDFKKYSLRLLEDQIELSSCISTYVDLISQLQDDILEPEEAVRRLRELSQK